MVCGIAIPSDLAVFRLIMNSNLVGSSTGSSAGLAPLIISSMYSPNGGRFRNCPARTIRGRPLPKSPESTPPSANGGPMPNQRCHCGTRRKVRLGQQGHNRRAGRAFSRMPGRVRSGLSLQLDLAANPACLKLFELHQVDLRTRLVTRIDQQADARNDLFAWDRNCNL
jgi:hypothetical protein